MMITQAASKVRARDDGKGDAFPKSGLIEGQKQRRVLFVDDEKVMRMIAGRLVGKVGNCSVTCASSGVEALKVLKDNEFEVILLDCVMPNMDGPTLFKFLTPEQQAKVIFQTAEEDVAKTLAWTGRPVLKKPWNAEKMMGAIEQVVEANKTD